MNKQRESEKPDLMLWPESRFETVESQEVVGMSPSQAVVNGVMDVFNDDPTRLKRVKKWLENEPDDMGARCRNDKEWVDRWVRLVLKKAVVDTERINEQRETGENLTVGYGLEGGEKEYYDLVYEMEKGWNKLERRGITSVTVDAVFPRLTRFEKREKRKPTKPEYRGVSTEDTGLDTFMGWFNRRFGKAFAAVTGISLLVGAVDTACTNAQPYTGPVETATVPGVATRGMGTQEATAVPQSTFEATGTNAPLVALEPTSFPNEEIKASYEGGDYKAAIEMVQSWVNLWAEKGLVSPQDIGGVGNTLNPNLIVGDAGLVCLDTRGKGTYAGNLLCLPLDLVNGGIRPLPTNGNWNRQLDSPLFLAVMPGNSLVTVGVGYDVTYQEVNAQGKAVRYVDRKTGLWVAGEYKPTVAEFSERYPALWTREYQAVVGNLTIPISIGLDSRTVNRETEPIKSVFIQTDVVDLLGYVFLHVCHERYLTDHPDTDFESFLSLVDQNLVKIKFVAFDESGGQLPTSMHEVEVNPKLGVSVGLYDGFLPVLMNNNYSMYISNSYGRLAMLTNEDSENLIRTYLKYEGNTERVRNYVLSTVFANLFVTSFSILGAANTRCILSENYPKSCGNEYQQVPNIDRWVNLIYIELDRRFNSNEPGAFVVKQE